GRTGATLATASGVTERTGSLSQLLGDTPPTVLGTVKLRLAFRWCPNPLLPTTVNVYPAPAFSSNVCELRGTSTAQFSVASAGTSLTPATNTNSSDLQWESDDVARRTGCPSLAVISMSDAAT